MDTIKVCDKQYLISKIWTVGSSEAEDNNNRMDTHSMVGIYNSRFTEECKRLSEDDIIINGVKYFKI